MILARFQRTFNVLAVLALFVAALAFGAAAIVSRDAHRVQLVEPADASVNALFGSSAPGTPIGSPQTLIIRDAGAFMDGRTDDGARYVDATYLQTHGQYPLQVKTVTFVRNLVVAGALGAAVLMALLGLLAGRAARAPVTHRGSAKP
ncbi:hypothetical protein [Deinococcus maricopensis]|uniref:Uncharacterized protein n=1 Tax=Deinococcus maricopensis (strain DSM 21211 / LMG 22137 / NRRL B-23946 / LB-34) TaxID=709986 RepID=E8U386_DEIML|nr:hypothetical protein [Deinococcus maricopensis]ADV66031.1 hypothetical protein Deima_0370 [Deinococcus maricopensis DSM 21211]